MSTSTLDEALHQSVLRRQADVERQRELRRARGEDAKEEYVTLAERTGGGSELSKARLKKIVDSDRRLYYRTLSLNEKLFIHCMGLTKLENLEDWTGLRSLYAETNAFPAIEGLEQCVQLRSLFLQENCIKTMDGLSTLKELWTLNLSSNYIETIAGLEELPNLNSLLVTRNRIGINGIEDLYGLIGSSVSCLDIQDNAIDDCDVLPEVLCKMPELKVLYLKGNPVCKVMPSYRKTIIAAIPQLKYLDDRPVFPEDRRAAEAFVRGGLEEERAERRRIKEEEKAAHERNMQAFRDMVESARERKKVQDEEDAAARARGEDPRKDRMDRLVREWEAENADQLKDDAREHAKKCLASEKPGGVDEEAARRLEALASEVPDILKPHGGQEDNRTLRYDDIWGDAPAASKTQSTPAAQQKTPAPLPKTAAPSSKSLGKATAASQKIAVAATQKPTEVAREVPSSARTASTASRPASAARSEAAETLDFADGATKLKIVEVDSDSDEEPVPIKASVQPKVVEVVRPPSGNAATFSKLDEMD